MNIKTLIAATAIASAFSLSSCGGGSDEAARPVETVTVTATPTATSDGALETAYASFVRTHAQEWRTSSRVDLVDLGHVMCDEGAKIHTRAELSAFVNSLSTIRPADVIVAMSAAASMLCPDQLANLDTLMAS